MVTMMARMRIMRTRTPTTLAIETVSIAIVTTMTTARPRQRKHYWFYQQLSLQSLRLMQMQERAGKAYKLWEHPI